MRHTARLVWVAALLVGFSTSRVAAEPSGLPTGTESRGQTDEIGEASRDEMPSGASVQSEDQSGMLDPVTIRQTIDALDLLAESEREQRVPALMDAIAQQPDAEVQGQLSQALDEKLAQLKMPSGESAENQHAIEGMTQTDLETSQEPEGFEAALEQANAPLPTEEEIRKQIDALTLDPAEPEIGLTEAWELAGMIDRLEDPDLQTALRRLLEDRVVALQEEVGIN